MKTCIRLVWFVLIPMVFIVFQTPARALEVHGEITVDAVWDVGMSPLTVTGDLVIAEGVTLTIRPGVRVEFANASSSSDGYHITVNGALTARGSEGDPIVFTARDTSRYWEYIDFTDKATAWDEDSETGSILEYCIVEYAGNGSDGAHGQAAVMMTGGAGTVRHSLVRYSKTVGILGYGGIFDIVSNKIHDTTCAIRLIEPLAARITGNHLIENEQGMDVDSASHGIEISGNTVVAASSEGYGACLALKLLYHDRLSAYRWRQIEGPAVTLSDAQALTPTFTVPDVSADESFVFQLAVTSLDGLIAVDTVTVQTGWDNQAPLADAGADQAVIEGARVMLDGTSSFDADDGIVSWDWLQTSGPAVTLTSSATTGQAYFTAPAVTGPVDEVVIVELSVTDSGGLSDRDTVLIRVADSAVHPEPVAEAGPLQSVNENTQVTLAGTLVNDPADAITVVSWFWERTAGDYVALTNAATQNATFTVTDVPSAGASYTFRLTVTDDEGNQSTDTVIVNVLDTLDAAPNEPPVALADITHNAVSITTVAEGTTNVILDGYANSSDPENNIDSYVWEQVAGPTVTLTSTGSPGEKRFTAPDVSEDTTLRFRLTVTDDHGLRAVDEIVLGVIWANQPPVARAGDDQTVNEGLRVRLDGSASTDDKAITAYTWSQVSGTPVILFNADDAKAYFATPDITADETLVFSLTVSDGAFPVQDLAHVRVLADDDPPVAEAGPDRVVAWGADPVTLDGSGSADPDDPMTGIVSYLWEQIGGPDVTLFDADTDAPHFAAPLAGDEDYVTLTFQLTVTDGETQMGVDTVVVNVTADPTGIVPTAVAGSDQTAPPGTVVTLSAAGSSDPQALPELTVTDNDFSLKDDTEQANALSLARDLHANVDLAITGNNLVQTLGRHLVLLHDVGSATGDIAMTGNWWGLSDAAAIADLIYDGVDNALLPEITFDPFEAGALDGAGSALSYPPMVLLGDDLTVDPDEPVTLDGTDTYDPDERLAYRWEQTGGKTVTLTGDDTVTATFNAPSITDEDEEGAEVLTFRLTITDPHGFFDSRSLTVTITTEEEEEAGTYGSSGCFIGTGLGRGLL